MKKMRADFSVREMCQAFDVSASGYWASESRRASARQIANDKLVSEIKAIHSHRYMRSYGSPRMTQQLLRAGHTCSKNRVARLMRENGVYARPRRPFRPKTTAPDHAAAPSPNLLLEAELPSRPAQHLLSDITYIPTQEGWLYLAVVIDRFSRMILGWQLSASLHSEMVVLALNKALTSGLVSQDAIFHSDRGCQYTAATFRSRLSQVGFSQSMSAKGYCYDNALAESFFASFKNEALPQSGRFDSRRAAAIGVFDYIESFYNRRRIHTSIANCSPLDFLNNFFQNQSQSLN
jgi:transposase InsO family protein